MEEVVFGAVELGLGFTKSNDAGAEVKLRCDILYADGAALELTDDSTRESPRRAVYVAIVAVGGRVKSLVLVALEVEKPSR